MTTRPGYIWSGSEWVSIGQEAVVAPISYQTSAPSTPSTGDIWIDSNDDVPGIDTSQFLRWRKTAVGGETSVSGTDDNGLTLQYTANYEQVYLNGVLLVRGQDYTATDGTSITGLTALAASDVVEVFGVVARVVGDVYTQAQADAKYSLQTTTGLVLLNTTSFTSSSAVSLNNIFSSSYENYRVLLNVTSMSTSNNVLFRFRVGGTDNSASSYSWASSYYVTSNAFYSSRTTGASNAGIFFTVGQDKQQSAMDFYGPYLSQSTMCSINGSHGSPTAAGDINWNGSLGHNSTTSFDGFTIYPSTGTITGTIKVYGYK